VGERTTCESGAGVRKSEIKFPCPLGVPSTASRVDGNRAEKKVFPRLVEPQFFFQVRKTGRRRMVNERLDIIVIVRTGATVDMIGIGVWTGEMILR
jgi:hypothetical protein